MKKVDHDSLDGGTPSKGKADDGIELGMTPLIESSVQSRSNRGTSNIGR